MKTVVITGSNGFIGKNLIQHLRYNYRLLSIDHENSNMLEHYLSQSDFIFHLAGVNRPQDQEEYESGNVGFTQQIVKTLLKLNKKTPIVFSSSTQVLLNNSYGFSKKRAEKVLSDYARNTNTPVYIFRLPNVFGKWSKPNYNSVVATFCYNISHGIDIYISDSEKELELVYIDDVINEFLNILNGTKAYNLLQGIEKVYRVKLGDLANRIYQFKNIRESLIIPDLGDEFTRKLYATYLSFLEGDNFSYKLDMKEDHRGTLFELIKSENFGQVFVSKSYKGVLRGNHYHHTKVEKFCVIKGKALIKLRNILNDETINYYVSDENIKMVDIPPGYTHSIENISDDELIVLFWANQIFNPKDSDTFYCEV